MVAGIGGGDPADVSLGSAVWADHVIDGDIAYEIDAREIPADWPTGMVPLRKLRPYEQPVRTDLEGELYTLNPALVGWAYRLTKDVALADTPAIRTARARFAGFPNALKPPFVTHGDTISGSTFWHGTRMDAWANAWTRYLQRRQLHDRGHGRFGHDAGAHVPGQRRSRRSRRVLVLRTVSNYDREAPGSTPAESLKGLVFGSYSAYLPALEAAQIVGDKVVRYLVEHWAACESAIPR